MKRRLFVAVVVSAFLGACNGSDSSGPAPGVGNYTLIKVNGNNVPVTTTVGPPLTQEITSGTLTLNANGTFTETRQGKITPTGGATSPITATSTGTWSLNNAGVITFSIPGSQGQVASTFNATLAGVLITYTTSGTTFTYQNNAPFE